MINPWWPLLTLAAVQAADAALCWKPVGFIRGCLLDVGFPRRLWRTLTPLKLVAAAALIAGIWYEPLALLTCVALVAYFLVAIAMHLRARDFGRNLFVNATGMLVLSTATLAFVVQAVW